MTVLLVVLGAAAGAPARYLADQALRTRSGFPLSTLTVNVAGSLLLGFLLGLPVPAGLAALLGTGFCGALTTFSTIALGADDLLADGATAEALLYVLVSAGLGLAAVAAGVVAGRRAVR